MAENEAGRPARAAQLPSGHHTANVILQRRADRAKAFARLRRLDERVRVGRLCHQAMPLTVWHGPRPLLDVPIGDLDARGRWAA